MLNNRSVYIEDVIIEGFKSFSEETHMSFKKGINVIIGNNGVGKSNILDAIAWCLGENDLYKLRCYYADEIFFAGNRQYPPAKTAAVTLKVNYSIGETKGTLNLTRKAYLSGEESYFIDSAQVSRAEYEEKLDVLGLNNVIKSIIRQEQINDIFSLPAEKRFDMISDLFGISDREEVTRMVTSSKSTFVNYMTTLVPRFNPDIVNENGILEILISTGSNTRRHIHQLSGGEKSIVSLAFKASLFDQLGSTIYLFDEVEPSLDYVNHKSIQVFLKDISKNKQLIIITHLRATVEMADTLHGVRARPDGSSFMKFYFVMDKRLLRLYKCC